MGAKLTEDEVDSVIHSVAKKMVERPYRPKALARLAETIAKTMADPVDREVVLHKAMRDPKELARWVEEQFMHDSEVWHYDLKKAFREHKTTFAEDIARAEAAGLAPFQNGAR